MAISWDISFSSVNVQSKRANVLFTRTDDQSTEPPWTYTVTQVIIDTPQQRSALLDQVWAKWQEEISGQSQVDTFLDNLAQTGKANLEARET